MSKSKSLNKALKKTAKRLEKTRNPIDKVAQLSSRSADIAQRVVSDGIEHARSGICSVVDISTNRLRSAQEERKAVDILQAQLDMTSEDIRSLKDSARSSFDNVADGVADLADEFSVAFKEYRAERKLGKFVSTPSAAKTKKAAPAKAAKKVTKLAPKTTKAA